MRMPLFRALLWGPLSIDSRATVAVLQEGSNEFPGTPGFGFRSRRRGPELDGLVDGFVCTPWRLSYVLQLPSVLEGSFRIANSDHRYTIKKATPLGVHVRPSETLTELRGWYMLYLDTMRRNAVPARPYRFFVALWELLQAEGVLQLLLAEQRAGGRSRIIAGTVFLRFGRTV